MEEAIAEIEDERSLTIPESPDPRLVRMLHLRLEGRTWPEVAREIGVDPKTVWKLRQKHNLDLLVHEITSDAIESTARGYLTLVRKAELRLREMLDSNDIDSQKFAIDRVYPKRTPDGAGALPVNMSKPRAGLPAAGGASPGKVAAERLRKR